MKKIICLAVILSFAVSIIFAAGGSEPRGNITIYTSMYEEIIEVIQKELRNEFPRCNIQFVYGGTGRLQNTIAVEKASGRLGCDILMAAEPAYSHQLKDQGLLHFYISTEAHNLAFDYDKEGYWYPVRIDNMVLAYSPARNAKNSVPNSFYDFANDTSVRDAISMRNPNISDSSMAALTALRDKYGYQYFDALGRQRVHIEYGNAEAIRKLESGEYRVIMILE